VLEPEYIGARHEMVRTRVLEPEREFGDDCNDEETVGAAKMFRVRFLA
jgi:hypothetical protein